MQERGGFLVGQSFGANVGDAVAVGVGAAWLRIPGDVDAEAVWGAEAGSFADQDYADFCGENFTDGIGDGYAGLFNNADGRDAPLGIEQRQGGVEKRTSVAIDGQSGKAVRNYKYDVRGRARFGGGGDAVFRGNMF